MPSSRWGIRNLILNISQPTQELVLSHLAKKKWKMRKDIGMLIPKKKEAGRGKQCTGISAKQTVVSGRDAVTVNLERKTPHTL